MGRWTMVTLLLVAAACGGGTLGARDATDHVATDAAIEADLSTPRDGDGDGTVDATSAPCTGQARHVVDGVVTNWTGSGDAEHEWSTATSFPGTHGTRYATTCDATLYLLNDLRARTDGPIPPDCFALTVLNLSGDLVTVRQYGDQRLDARAAGATYPGVVDGAAGFARSPDQPLAPHAQVELALGGPAPGPFALCSLNPVGATGCDDDALLVEETSILLGQVRADGSLEANAIEGLPFVTALEPPAAAPADDVVVSGFRFGDAQGALYVDDLQATVVAWSAGEVRFVVPAVDPGLHEVRLFAGKREAPAVNLRVSCQPACDGRECGPDGCGGSCGACPPAAPLCQDGACACAPQCQGLECGPDGCGGSCGTCPPGDTCEDGACVCVPDCFGKQCGTDNCGSTCGVCAQGEICKQWECRCEPQCQDRQCGDDGCGGSCGLCPDGQPCVDGACVCAPACEGRQCGDDGCGGSCGTCPATLWCVEGLCDCLPNCLNRDCGDDDCGGVCGVCQPDETCVGHHCHTP